MIQLAWMWLRHQPGSALSQWFQIRAQNGSAKLRKVMIVALARKLLIALWKFVNTGLVPEGAVMTVA
jgi:transposase